MKVLHHWTASLQDEILCLRNEVRIQRGTHKLMRHAGTDRPQAPDFFADFWGLSWWTLVSNYGTLTVQPRQRLNLSLTPITPKVLRGFFMRERVYFWLIRLCVSPNKKGHPMLNQGGLPLPRTALATGWWCLVLEVAQLLRPCLDLVDEGDHAADRVGDLA